MKKIVSYFLVLSILVSSLTCLSGCSKKESDSLTRAEWIGLIGEQFGLGESVTNSDYFVDVNKNNEYYQYVQSCADWGVIDNQVSMKFEPNKDATMEFALETVLKVANVDIPEDASVIDTAISEGLIEDNSYFNVRGKLTQEKASELLAWATVTYIKAPTEEVVNVVVKEEVVNLAEETTETILQMTETDYVVKEEIYDNFSVGDVVIFPGDEYNPSGIARKIIAVEKNADGTYDIITEEPSIEEVCADLEVATVVVPTIDNVILCEGVTVSQGMTDGFSFSTGNNVAFLNNVPNTSDNNIIMCSDEPQGLNVSFDINFTKGTIGVSQSWQDFLGMGENVKIGGSNSYTATTHKSTFENKSIIPDKNLFGKDPYDNTEAIESYKAGKMSLDDLKKELDLSKDQHEKEIASMQNKFSGGYSVTGKVSLNNFYVIPELKLKSFLGIPTGIEKITLTINYDIAASLALQGELKEEFTVCTIPVPVGGTGVTVELQLIIFAAANGELSVKAEISNMFKAEYTEGKTKKTSEQSSSLSAKAELTIDVGPKFAIDVRVLGISIVDANVSAAVRFKAGISGRLATSYSEDEENITISRTTTCDMATNAYIPIVSVGIGVKPTSLANKLKITFSWQIIGEKKAHQFEIAKDSFVIWEETVSIPKIVSDGENTDEQDNSNLYSDYLTLDIYYVGMQSGEQRQLQVTNIPAGYTEADIIWSTSDASIARIDNGVVSSVFPGTAIITVQTTDGVYLAECAITVEEEEIHFTPLEGVIYY